MIYHAFLSSKCYLFDNSYIAWSLVYLKRTGLLNWRNLLVDMAWNKIITTDVILFYARDKSIPLKSDKSLK